MRTAIIRLDIFQPVIDFLDGCQRPRIVWRFRIRLPVLCEHGFQRLALFDRRLDETGFPSCRQIVDLSIGRLDLRMLLPITLFQLGNNQRVKQTRQFNFVGQVSFVQIDGPAEYHSDQFAGRVAVGTGWNLCVDFDEPIRRCWVKGRFELIRLRELSARRDLD